MLSSDNVLQLSIIYIEAKVVQFQPFCCWNQGAVSIRKTVFSGVAIPMLKIRRPNGRLIFNIGIAIPR